MRKFLIPVLVVSLLIGCVSVFTLKSKSVSAQVNYNIDTYMDELNKSIYDDPQKAMSSNPYTYVKNNKYFDAIVDLGPDALPSIEKAISDSPKNGLREYILAIAGERIAKVNLKGDSVKWDSAKKWVTVWNEHLKELSNNVKRIAGSNSTDKTNELVKLGTPAIPYLMDLVEADNKDVIPALTELLKDNKQKIDASDVEITKEWVKKNKDKFVNLRKMVDEKANQN